MKTRNPFYHTMPPERSAGPDPYYGFHPYGRDPYGHHTTNRPNYMSPPYAPGPYGHPPPYARGPYGALPYPHYPQGPYGHPSHPQGHHGYPYPQEGGPYGRPDGRTVSQTGSKHNVPENPANTRLIKGALIGAAAAYLLTNENVQQTAIRSVVKIWNLARSGAEELKERFQDAHAEILSDEE